MGAEQSRRATESNGYHQYGNRQHPLPGERTSIAELQRQAETGVFSDSESDVMSDDASDSQSDDGVWMVLPSALNPSGRTFRKVATQGLDEQEQLQLVKRRVRATRLSMGHGTQETTGESTAVSPKDFQCIKVIGVGGMGRVLLVRCRRDGKLYAMKVVSKRSVREKDMASRVLSERDVLGGTYHHSLVHLHWAFQTNSSLYFVMEYCPGGELSTQLQKVKRFTEQVAIFYASELVIAVQHLHQHGILHRDLKPENLLLTEDGHLKLVDFGISTFGITEATRGAKTMCGSYEYLAPEMLKGEEYGTAADWWAFGAVLYELLTGLPPWYSENPDEMRDWVLHSPLVFPNFVSPEAKDLLSRLLHRNPIERLGSQLGGSEIQDHGFFRGVDWEMVTFGEAEPPIRPCSAPEVIADGSNFRSEGSPTLLKRLDSSGGGSFSESFRGFNFEAPTDQQIEYSYSRDVNRSERTS